MFNIVCSNVTLIYEYFLLFYLPDLCGKIGFIFFSREWNISDEIFWYQIVIKLFLGNFVYVAKPNLGLVPLDYVKPANHLKQLSVNIILAESNLHNQVKKAGGMTQGQLLQLIWLGSTLAFIIIYILLHRTISIIGVFLFSFSTNRLLTIIYCIQCISMTMGKLRPQTLFSYIKQKPNVARNIMQIMLTLWKLQTPLVWVTKWGVLSRNYRIYQFLLNVLPVYKFNQIDCGLIFIFEFQNLKTSPPRR